MSVSVTVSVQLPPQHAEARPRGASTALPTRRSGAQGQGVGQQATYPTPPLASACGPQRACGAVAACYGHEPAAEGLAGQHAGQGRNGTCGEAQSGDRHPSCRPRPRGRLGEGALHVPHSLLAALMQLAGLDSNLWQRVCSPVNTGYAVCGVGPVGMHREMFAMRTGVSPSVSQVWCSRSSF